MLPVYIKQESLKFSLIMLINKIELSTNMLVSYYIEDIEFSDNIKLHLYRITQECINNSLKHSNGNAINVQLKKNKSIVLEIEDDGDGFIINETNINNFGLVTIKQRALAIGAKIEIESKIKEGTKIIIKL
jgi:two-component system sensor histidine kinase DegS